MVASSLVLLVGGFVFSGEKDSPPRPPLVGVQPFNIEIPPGVKSIELNPPPPDSKQTAIDWPEREAAKPVSTVRPVGTWKRDVGSCHVTLRIENDRLFGTCRLVKEEEIVTIEMEADYSVTKDSVLYGVVSSVEIKLPESTKENAADARTNALKFIDQPFSIRFRVDEGVLTVKDMKMGGIGLREQPRDRDDELLSVIVGRYSSGSSARQNQPAPAIRGVRY